MRLIKILDNFDTFDQSTSPYLLCPCCSKFFKHALMKGHMKTLRHRDNTNQIKELILRIDANFVEKPLHYDHDKKIIHEFNKLCQTVSQ